MRFGYVLLLAAATGYISLSQEILWIRVLGNADQGRPQVFAHVLGFFLLGIAFGALLGRRIQARFGFDAMSYIGGALSLTGALYYLAFPVCVQILLWSPAWGMAAFFAAIAAIAFLMGGVFPVLCHSGIRSDGAVGLSLSWVYLANIAGATGGPLLTGFWLLDAETTEHNILMLSALTLGVAQLVWRRAASERGRRYALVGTAAVLACMLAGHERLFHHFMEKLHFPERYDSLAEDGYLHQIQNRSGVVSVWGPDMVFGGGVYDGRLNIDPVHDTNMISRAYFLPALHPAPKSVLMVGLGGGAWARAVADYGELEQLTVVEINFAYVDVMWHYPEIASVLDDDKVTVYHDDARRWLNRHPDRRFDAIVMNTTFHWRSHATHVLSAEFLQEAKKRLAPGGIVYFNTTGSNDAVYTASGVFRHVVRYLNFAAASDAPFDMAPDARRANIAKFTRGGQPLFSGPAEGVLDSLAVVPTPDVAVAIQQDGDLWYITDDNMASEYKANGPGKWWRDLWRRMHRPERAWHRVLF